MLYVSANTSDFIAQFVVCWMYYSAKECVNNEGISLLHKAVNIPVACHHDNSNQFQNEWPHSQVVDFYFPQISIISVGPAKTQDMNLVITVPANVLM